VLGTAAALADGVPITRAHLPALAHGQPSASEHLPLRADGPVSAALPADAARASPHGDSPPGLARLNPIQVNERQLLLQMLEQHRWNVSNVAKALDVSRNTLYRKIHKLQIEVSHPEPDA